jgi:hypothetical protein
MPNFFTMKLTVLRTIVLLLIAPVFMKTDCNTTPPPNPSADEYFTWQMQGGPNGALNSAPDIVEISHQPGFTSFGGISANSSSVFQLDFVAPQVPGNYAISNFTLFTNTQYFVKTTAALNLTIATYGIPGQYVLGSYNGVVKDSASTQTYPISGTFKIRNQ